MRMFLSQLLDVVLWRRREKRLREEIQAHLDLLADDFVSRGVSPADAQLAARKAFGGVDQMKERHRDQRGLRAIDDAVQDARYAFRLVRRDPWFTAATVLALALGIGLSATMVTLLYGMNLRGLPFHDAHELVGVTAEPTRSQGGQVSYAVFLAWREASRSFAGLSAEVGAPINLGDEARATDQFSGTFLSHNAFALLGERPVLGRDFRPTDDRPGAEPVIIIGYRVWTDRYGGDPSIIGRTVRANGEAVTVIGVMPEGFWYPVDTQIWRPLASLPGINAPTAGSRPVRIVGRLADDVGPRTAEAELAAILSTVTSFTEADRARRTIIMPLNETYVGRVTQPVPMMMLAAVTVVLLIACSHAASLWLARSIARGREMSMRAALGAGRGRLMRQLLIESVLSALLAGVVGVAITWVLVRAFANEVSGFGLPYWTRFTFDAPLVLVLAMMCVVTGVAFGLLPAWQQSRVNLNEVLNQSGRSGTTSPRVRRMTGVLLVGELALTVVLLASAVALARSATVVYRADQTVDVENVWHFRIALPPTTYGAGAARAVFYDALERRLAVAPGTESAALASAPPFNARDSRGVAMDRLPADPGALPSARLVAIGPRYFETLGLRVVRGSRLEDVNPASRATSVLVNEQFVQRFSPGTEPIGREVWLINERVPDAAPQRHTIVGVAPPLRQQVAAGHTPVVYLPFDAEPGATASILIRGRPDQFADVVRQEVRRLDPDLPLFGLQSLERISYNSRWVQRIMSTAFLVVAVVATILCALGLYSLTAYTASQRTQEVGVRVALGARCAQVSWLFVRDGLRFTLMGLGIGLGLAVAVGTILQSALVDVRANHPASLLFVCLLLAAVTMVAAALPARRAARLDPVLALRHD
jgi:putative ABC transport system permease protein